MIKKYQSHTADNPTAQRGLSACLTKYKRLINKTRESEASEEIFEIMTPPPPCYKVKVNGDPPPLLATWKFT